jgi:hypothetical protein
MMFYVLMIMVNSYSNTCTAQYRSEQSEYEDYFYYSSFHAELVSQ